MIRPRNDGPAHPLWCRADRSDPDRHVSGPVRVGHRPDGGEVTAYLIADVGGPVWVRVLAVHMTAATADISLDDAATLRDGLTALLQAAGRR